ncbi:MAG: hypothetical protein RLZ87_522 [Armatimonadota bacterium]
MNNFVKVLKNPLDIVKDWNSTYHNNFLEGETIHASSIESLNEDLE